MATARRTSAARERGEIETLAGGSLRVTAYAGVDPLSGRRRYLSETVPAGPKALAEARKARTRLIGQVDDAAWLRPGRELTRHGMARRGITDRPGGD